MQPAARSRFCLYALSLSLALASQQTTWLLLVVGATQSSTLTFRFGVRFQDATFRGEAMSAPRESVFFMHKQIRTDNRGGC
uniref:Putative secreted protein n=1 Tax=Anopheles darlingi TaxID=43151 RepID=A0A2M4DEP8_ANODA